PIFIYFIFTRQRHPTTTLFPYTTLFRSDDRSDPEDPRADDARDERGHAGLRPRVRVLRSHPPPSTVLPPGLHRRRDRDEHGGRPVVDPAPFGRHLPL